VAILALGLVGAAVGGSFGFASIGWMVGSLAGQLLFQKTQKAVNEGPRMQDTRVTASTYGVGIPIIKGMARTAGNIMWHNPVREHVHEQTEEVGKGGGQEVTNRTWSYDWDFAVGICGNEILGIRRIWEDGALIYDVGAGATTADILAANANAGQMTIYLGTETQMPDPTMEATEGAGNVPAHRGMAYIVFQNRPWNGHPPQLEFEVVASGSNALLAVPTIYTSSASLSGQSVWNGGNTIAVLGGNGAAVLNFFNAYNGAFLTANTPLSTTFATLNYATVVMVGAGGLCRDLEGNYWMIARTNINALGAFIGAWGFRENGELFKIGWVGIDPSTGIPRGEAIADADGYIYFSIDGETIRRFKPETLPAFPAAGGATTTHVETFATRNSADANRWLFRDPFGHPTWLGQTTHQVHRIRGGAIQSIAIGGTAFDLGYLSDGLRWDRNNNLWVAGCYSTPSTHWELKRLNFDTGAVEQTIVLPNSTSLSLKNYDFGHDGFLYVNHDDKWSKRETSAGTIQHESAGSLTVAQMVPTLSAVFYFDDLSPGHLKLIEPLPRMTATDTETVGGVVDDICELAGLDAAERDVSQLTETLHGFIIGRPMTARSAIELLQKAYWFDAVESDLVLKFVMRGGAVAVEMPTDDLGARQSGADEIEAIEIRRLQEDEMPRQVLVNFWNKDADYAAATEYDRRLVTRAQEQVFEEFPLALSPERAAQIAEVLLYDKHLERTQFEWSTGIKFTRYEPTDVVELLGLEGTHRVRITNKSEEGLLIKWRGVSEDDGTIYDPVAVGATDQSPQSMVSIGAPTTLHLLDIPLLRERDDDAGFYAFFSPLSANWRGATLYGSPDDVAFTELASSTSGTVAGYVSAAPGNFLGGNIVDELNSITVVLDYGELSSVDDAGLMRGDNTALAGTEILSFRDATLVSGTTYKLTGLLRGRVGTERFVSSHAAGERFVFLSPTGGRRITRPTTEIGVARWYKGVSFNASIADAPSRGFTNSAAGLKPMCPVDLSAFRHQPALNDWTFYWSRRTRFGGQWRDFVDVPLNEESESYEVDFISVSSNAVVRTVTVDDATTVVYTAAQQTTDFGAPQSTIRVAIYQMSAIVGRGFPSEITF
jgi:hypothetical protein